MNTRQSINKQFSKKHLSLTLEALVAIKGGEVTYTGTGICGNADTLLSLCCNDETPFDVYTLLGVACQAWSKHSGSYLWPVPSPNDKEDPMDAYEYSNNLWTGEYGQLRYELLDFLIEELTKAVKEYDND